MKVAFSTTFRRRIKQAPRNIQAKFKLRLSLFLEDPFNRLLNTHILTGKSKGYHSMDVTLDWRTVFRFLDEDTVYFSDIGQHSNLYR
jgi:mRNA-degrading endonuclease YafQ of YafQ-DinJ toxin-antitoxin module